jgi:hypothetical protein
MKNVTITLPELLARRARVEAAKAGKSLSRWIGDLVQRDLPSAETQKEAMTLRDFLAGPGWPGVAKDLPKRDELYDRPALRRHEPADLRNGSGRAGKARKGK